MAQGRVASDGTEQRGILRERPSALLIIGGTDQPFVGDEQRPLDAGLRARRGKLGDPAGARPDGRRIIPIAAQSCAHIVTLK